MPRNLSTLQQPQSASPAPAAPGQRPQVNPDPEPLPGAGTNPKPAHNKRAKGPDGADGTDENDNLEETIDEEPQPGVIHIKTSHIVAGCLVLGFFAGSLATFFFLHPDSKLRPIANTATLPKPEDNTQIAQLKNTVDKQNTLIEKLEKTPRSRIGLPIQTTDPRNPGRVTYTPQDVTIAAQWISKSSSDITWLCNAPLDPTIVGALNLKKSQNSTILVIAGNQALRPNLTTALRAEYNVYQSRLPLSDTTSILIIDSKLVVDLSNSDFVWATAEPTVVSEITTYAITTLLKNATHIQN